MCWPAFKSRRPTYHFPNFSFVRSRQSFRIRRIHSTFSIRERRVRRHPLHRRHTVQFACPAISTPPLQTSDMEKPSSNDEYHPPPGPPPGYKQDHHIHWGRRDHSNELDANNVSRAAHKRVEQGMPLYNDAVTSEYKAPPGPSPQQKEFTNTRRVVATGEDYAPPPGPPPSHVIEGKEPPPYDPWLAVPDNSLLPPPPSFHESRSPTANASYDDAAQGHAWCRSNPLWQPQCLSQHTLARLISGDVRLTTSPGAKNVSLSQVGIGVTHLRSTTRCTDSIFLSDIPLYAATHQPNVLRTPVTIYYEVLVKQMGSGEGDSGIAIGFLAPPYPSWRLPGWHRASFGVHGDDGRRYVDDSYGGQNFTSVFRRGDVVGVGMKFQPPLRQGDTNRCEIFFTRNGKHDGGWNLHEERDRDREEGDVTGLEGKHDLLAAVGCFGAVEFEARFRRQDWLWRG